MDEASEKTVNQCLYPIFSMNQFIRPYAEQHAHVNGPGDSRPTAEDVVQDQNLVGKLRGLIVLITGCTSGIGVESARALYLTGVKLYITARDIKKGQQIAAELTTDPARPVKVLEMSLDSFESVRQAAASFLQQEKTLNILINNAGVMACPYAHTKDGHELQFGTNHLGHFLLFQLLKPALLAGASPDRPSRVVAVSSAAHRISLEPLPFDDLDFQHTAYNQWLAYGRSKLANIYFANELTRRYGEQHLHALSLHPGSIVTPLQRHVQDDSRYKEASVKAEYLAQVKSVQQGAATTVWAAVGQEWMHRGGVYLDNVGETAPSQPDGPSWQSGHSAIAFRPQDEKKLWEISNRLCETEG